MKYWSYILSFEKGKNSYINNPYFCLARDNCAEMFRKNGVTKNLQKFVEKRGSDIDVSCEFGENF